MRGYWRKLPKETGKTHGWGGMTITEGGAFTTRPAGPESWEVVVYFVELPFRLLLLRLFVKAVSFLIRPGGPSPPAWE